MLVTQETPAGPSDLIALLRQRITPQLLCLPPDPDLPNSDFRYFEGPLIPAAVLVGVVLHNSVPTVLLTRRTAHLRDHAGQVSFPGGRCESDDADATATALREAHEEVGLHPDYVEVIGRLPEFRTITGFSVTPVVGLIRPGFALSPDSFEVESVFEPPLAFLLDAANHVRHNVEYQGRQHSYWSMPWNDYLIWGATAGMLLSLRQALNLTD